MIILKNTSAKLLIATFNPGKFQEYQLIFRDVLHLPIKLLSLNDLGIKAKVEENGKTYQENALLKAKFYAQLTELPVLADDSGLEIEVLGGWPGLRSRRDENGQDLSDEALIQRVLKRMKGLSWEQRKARYKTVVVLIIPPSDLKIFEGTREGIIVDSPDTKIWEGFPFDSIFYLPEKKEVFVRLSREDKARFSQRAVALQKAKPFLETFFQK